MFSPNEWAPLESETKMPSMSLETVGRYEIIGELGRGAMGVVYKAKDPTIGRTVALKTMRLDVHGLDAAEMMRRFQNEARAAGVLNHPNIVTIYDAGQQDGIFYIAMEFIQGTTLHELIAEKHILTTEEVIQYSRQICKGLDYAHSHGIVHRDVKPANIMITANGTVKIMDFGIAKSGGSMTSTGQVLGTPNYMAPEQVKGRQLDGRSDLFSFGVILYEMLTGEKPFVGQNVTTIIYKIVNENPIPPRELDVTVHPGLSAIVVKSLAKQPDERYQTGADLVHDLENYKSLPVNPESTSARVAGAPMHATSVSPNTATSSLDRTVVLPVRVVGGSALLAPEAVPAPRKAPVPMRRKTAASNPRTNKMLAAVVGAVVLLGSTMGAFAYYRTHSKMRQIESAVKAVPQAQSITSPTTEQISSPDASAGAGQTSPQTSVPTAGKSGNSVIARDTTVKYVSQTSAMPASRGKAAASPNQVFTQQSELKFATKPDGAKVEVDGWSEPSWVTPFTASHLAAGLHTVVFTKPGFIPQTLTVETSTGKSQDVNADLTPAVSTIVVNSNPQGANIWLDGRDTGQTTPSQLTVDKGIHRVSVRKAGYKDAATETTLAEGQTTSFSPVMLSANQRTEDGPSSNNFFKKMIGADTVPDGKGLVHVRTVPEGATIIVDGKTAPKHSNARWPAEPGIYTIILQMDGYKTVHRNVRVQLGKITPLDEILEKQ